MNNDLISRSDVKDHIGELLLVYSGEELANAILNAIDNAPTVDTYTIEDIQEVRENSLILGAKLAQRPEGEWKVYAHQGGVPISDYCTNCKYEMKWYRNKYNFCPKCGAKMLNGCISVFS